MNKKPLVLAILDGYGYSENINGNAILNANTPFMDYLKKTYDHTYLHASGEYVGLPENQIGNSEVGHLNIGAGRVVYTGLSLINHDIKTKKFYSNTVLNKAIDHAKKNNSKIHIMGLLSNGGVHSSQEHIFEMIKIISKNNLTPIIHCFGDGRDVAPKSIINFLKELKEIIKKNNGVIGSIAGRFYAMDRDQRWERTKQAYDNLLGIENEQNNKFDCVIDYVEKQYENNITDEFLNPARLNNKDVIISNNDAIIFANFRPDRARQLSHLFCKSEIYNEKNDNELKNIYFATMMNYEGINPDGVLFPSQVVKNTMGKVLETNNLKQLRIAETEKYAHVTYFFDGGVEISFKNQDKILIDSPKVKTYDQKPEMAAKEITDKLIEVVENYDVVILNFANPDMIGHTGAYKETVYAIEVIDKQLERIYQKLKEINGVLFVTADHGNAEEMIDLNNNPITKHTTNPVIFIGTDKDIKLKNGSLANVATTILDYLNLDIPFEMDAKSLLIKK